jgi:hypothetical protein
VLGAHDIGQHLREASLTFSESGQVVSRISGQDVVGVSHQVDPLKQKSEWVLQVR